VNNLNVWVRLIRELHICRCRTDSDTLIESLLCSQGTPRVLSFINAHAAMMSLADDEFSSDLLCSDYLLRDGVGMKFLLNAVGVNSGLNMNGSDFIPKLILSYDRRKRIALMGTNDEVLSEVFKKLSALGFESISVIDGFQPDYEYVQHVQDNLPGFVILAMGMPKQERIARKISFQFPGEDMLIVNGGAVLDFISGKVTRAPIPFRKSGLEWLYRFLREPQRMFSRNVRAIAFLYYVKKHRIRLRAALNVVSSV